jgi:predicted metal-binding membrane protein
MLAFAIGKAAGWLSGGGLHWNQAGRVLAGVTLLVAAAYQLSPVKEVCIGKCRSPLGLLLGSWRDGRAGAVKMGTRNGAWCVGCCWALMASLFALGVMSVVWMAVVAGLITIEKTLPWRRPASYGTALLLTALGVVVLAAPELIPALTIPPTHMQPMAGMGA